MEFVCPLLVLVDDQSLCGRPLTYTSYSGILLLVCLQEDCDMSLCKYTAVLPKFWQWRSLVPRYFVPRREWRSQSKEQPHREQDSFEAVPCEDQTVKLSVQGTDVIAGIRTADCSTCPLQACTKHMHSLIVGVELDTCRVHPTYGIPYSTSGTDRSIHSNCGMVPMPNISTTVQTYRTDERAHFCNKIVPVL